MSSTDYCADGSNSGRNCICAYADEQEWEWDGDMDSLCRDGWVAWQEIQDDFHAQREAEAYLAVRDE